MAVNTTRITLTYSCFHVVTSLLLLHTGIWIPLKPALASTFISDRDIPTKRQKIVTVIEPIDAIAPKKIPTIPEPYQLGMTQKQQEQELHKEMSRENLFPPGIPVKESIGKSIGLMKPRSYALHHPAATLLKRYSTTGCPVDCGPQWTLQHIIKMLKRGPHKSATSKRATKALRDETDTKIKQGYSRIVKWGEIKDSLHKNFKLSPVAMIPHKSRSFRCILDLSFQLKQNEKIYPSVNNVTNRQAKTESMAQLGHVLQRIVELMADNFNKEIPFKFTKLDIKDGFWRLSVNDQDSWNFCYVLASTKNTPLDQTEIVVPNCLQMGWCESPPFFCSGSETARDVIQKLTGNILLPPHTFEHKMLQESTQKEIESKDDKTLIEVFVDDFIGASNTQSHQKLVQISRAMLHGIHTVFPPTSVTNHSGEDPISQKKLLQGEGTWHTTKEILGWIFNGADYTIQLPVEKCNSIITTIRKIKQQKTAPLNTFQKIAGRLQHASFGIPGGRSLFSPIQAVMANNPEFIPLTETLKQTLRDWSYMIGYLKQHPTSVLQLIVDSPWYIGYSDACKLGAGGIWCSGIKHLHPLLWQVEWPLDIQEALITDKNPKGYITINDLELAGIVLNWMALELTDLNLKYAHIATFCDNTSAVAWSYKMRTSKSVAAGKLLRLLGMRIHQRKASTVIPSHIAGEKNDMADIVSRAFKSGKYFAASHSLTNYFNTNFPLPQKQSWKESKIPPQWTSRVMSCLRGEMLDLASLLELPTRGLSIGNTGAHMPTPVASMHGSKAHHPSNATLSSWHSLQGSGQVILENDAKSKQEGLPTRLRRSARPSNWLENPARSTDRKTSTG